MVHTRKYIPIQIDNPDNNTLICTKVWILNTLHYEWLIGRNTASLLSNTTTLNMEIYEHKPETLEDIESELDDMPCSLLPTTPRPKIDYKSIKIGVPELKPIIHQ